MGRDSVDLLARGMVSLHIALAAPTSSLACSGSLQDPNTPANGQHVTILVFEEHR